LREKFYSQKFCHPACPPVEEVAFDEGFLYLKFEKQGCFAKRKMAQHDKKKTGQTGEIRKKCL